MKMQDLEEAKVSLMFPFFFSPYVKDSNLA